MLPSANLMCEELVLATFSRSEYAQVTDKCASAVKLLLFFVLCMEYSLQVFKENAYDPPHTLL